MTAIEKVICSVGLHRGPKYLTQSISLACPIAPTSCMCAVHQEAQYHKAKFQAPNKQMQDLAGIINRNNDPIDP
jgi:hypothetical protein